MAGMRDSFAGMSAHARHQQMMGDWLRFYGGASEVAAAGGLEAQAASHRASQLKQTDMSALQQGHRFIRSAEDDAEDSIAARLAQKYYSRLFKEYCIADLSRYKESKLGLRWRSQREVVAGKGHFTCGAKGCDAPDGLVSFEVNFAYQEAGKQKQALVKLRVCPGCAFKLNYRKEKQFRKVQAKTLQDAIASGKGAKRSRGEAGSDGGAGEAGAGRPASKARSVYEVGEAKDWVVAPPLRQQQQQQMHDQKQREQQQEQQEQQQQQASVLPGDASVWEHKAPEAAATLEEEMDSYLDAMFV